MVYQWKKNSRSYGVSADVAGNVFRDLSEEGRLTARDVVAVSTPEEAPLHPCFEWDNAKAGNLYREGQARSMIRAVVYVPEEKVLVNGALRDMGENTSVFFNIPVTATTETDIDVDADTDTDVESESETECDLCEDDEYVGHGFNAPKRVYKPLDVILADKTDTELLLMQAKRDMIAFVKKYKTLTELADVVAVMEKFATIEPMESKATVSTVTPASSPTQML